MTFFAVTGTGALKYYRYYLGLGRLGRGGRLAVRASLVPQRLGRRRLSGPRKAPPVLRHSSPERAHCYGLRNNYITVLQRGRPPATQTQASTAKVPSPSVAPATHWLDDNDILLCPAFGTIWARLPSHYSVTSRATLLLLALFDVTPPPLHSGQKATVYPAGRTRRIRPGTSRVLGKLTVPTV